MPALARPIRQYGVDFLADLGDRIQSWEPLVRKKDELWQVLRGRSRALVLHGDAGLDLNLVVVIREPSEAAAIAAEGRIYGAALYFLDDGT